MPLRADYSRLAVPVPNATARAVRARPVWAATVAQVPDLGPVNFSWITPDLALGGRLSNRELEALPRLGIGAVIDLRSEAVDEEAVLRESELDFLHLPTDDHAAITPPMLASGVEFSAAQAAQGRRILVHCEHGIGRSATLLLCVLVSRGLAPTAALRLAKDRRERVSPSPAQYECWRAWLEAWREANRCSWDIPDFDAFAAVAYRHLRAPVA